MAKTLIRISKKSKGSRSSECTATETMFVTIEMTIAQIKDEINTRGIKGGNFNSSQPKRIKTPLIKCVKTIPNRISETMFT